MLLQIPQVLTAEQVAHCRDRLATGRVGRWPHHRRLPVGARRRTTRSCRRTIRWRANSARWCSKRWRATRRSSPPRCRKRIYPPLFNRYGGGQSFGFHVDNAIRYDRSRGGAEPIRTDLSATLFLSSPEEYDGGELVIEDTYGVQR